MRFSGLTKNVANWPQYIKFRLGLNTQNPIGFTLKPTPIRLNMITSMKPLFNEIFLKKVYGPALENVKSEKPVILDIGGNMGYFALYSFLRKPKAKVFSFEPVPTNFGYLKEHAEQNPDLDWQIFNTAVSNQSGELEFYYNQDCSPEGVDISGSLFPPDRIFTVHETHRPIKVPVLDLGSWMSDNAVTRCDLLKLDCEGAEYNILYSLPDKTFEGIRYIVADVHQMSAENENITALAAFLRKKGYDVKTENNELLYAKRS